MSTLTEALVMDLNAFADENFDVKQWINQAMRNKNADEFVEVLSITKKIAMC